MTTRSATCLFGFKEWGGQSDDPSMQTSLVGSSFFPALHAPFMAAAPLIFLCSAGLCSAFPQIGSGADGDSTDKHTDLPPAVVAIIENGERLRSGEYQARGRISFTLWDRDRDFRRKELAILKYDEFIDAAFDFDADKTLFRRKRVRTKGAPNPLGMEEYRWYLSTADLTVELRGNEHFRTAILYPPTQWSELWPNEGRAAEPMPVFDPRLLGWGGWSALAISFDAQIESAFLEDELRTYDEGGGIYRIEAWHKLKPEDSYKGRTTWSVQSWWCDENQGWQPVRYSWRMPYDESVPGADELNQRRKPYCEAQLSWEQHGAVWVANAAFVHLDYTSKSDLQLSFDWKNVNQPIPQERFDWTRWKFGKPWEEGTDYHSLEDARLGNGQRVNAADKRGDPRYEIDLASPIAPRRPNPVRTWLILANAAAVGVCAGWLARRIGMTR